LETVFSKKATRIWVAVLCIWIVFVWTRSMVGGEESSEHSMFFVHLLSGVFNAFGVTSEATMNFIVRKCAHFTEYAVMGAVATRAFAPRTFLKRKWFAIQAALLLIIPSIDETIQLFVPGRSGLVTEVMIDFSGAITGSLICCLLMWLHIRRKRAAAGKPSE
jgi:VanZ family protein